MCDDHTVQDEKTPNTTLTRREFNTLAAGATLAFSLPKTANAQSVTRHKVQVNTSDGVCDAFFVHPKEGKHPAVLMWPDILALRPSFEAMAGRLAESGYAVLCINPYYRDAKAPVVETGESFRDESTQAKVLPMYRNLSPETHVRDARAFVDWLDQQASVDTTRAMGTMGYCMGGPMVMRAAATRADRIGAACAYHPVSLATDAQDSPHLLIPEIKASTFIALAENDDERNPDDKHVLKAAFEAQALTAHVQVFDGALHGWCVLDSRVYNEAPAECAWAQTLALFEASL
ncbi:MAG: dienelactone hydrolase family protein [Luminiphilus sp.]|nr:dienelactone hydrolase family protein [Luminiphilus sp.]